MSTPTVEPDRNPLLRVLSVSRWLPGYERGGVRDDVVAGLTVAFVLIPQSMAYALLAGVPPVYGLYASLVPLVIYPLLGTSRQLAVGVIAIDMILVATGLEGMAPRGSAQYVELAILLALMVGVIQLAMGLARMGFLVNLLSRPVVSGFTAGAALIIAFSQVGDLMGAPVPRDHRLHALVMDAFGALPQVHAPSLTLGVGTVVLLLVGSRWKPAFPTALLVVALGGLLVWGLDLRSAGVQAIGEVPGSLPTPSMPDTSLATLRALAPTAVTLALVQFMTVMSLGRVFAFRNGYFISANRELVAVGTANLLGSFFRAIPVSGSFSRTAVNARAGAVTPVANAVTAGAVLMTLLFLTPLLQWIPVPVLAAIIVVAALSLLDLKEMGFLLRAKRPDGGIAVLALLTTAFVGVQEGVLVGIAASVVMIMYRLSRPNTAVLGHLPGTRSFRDVAWSTDAYQVAGILILRIDASFSFANAELVKDLILEESAVKSPDVRAVIIDASSINDLDTTAAQVLRSVKLILDERDIDLYFAGVKEPVRKTLERSGIAALLGEDSLFLSPHRAVKHVLGRDVDELEAYLANVPGEGEKPREPRSDEDTRLDVAEPRS